MTNLSPEEADLVNETKAALAEVKGRLRDIAKNMRRMGQINRDAFRAKPANAAMLLEGAALEALGKVTQAHAVASDAVCECFDDGPVIVFGGGGGR